MRILLADCCGACHVLGPVLQQHSDASFTNGDDDGIQRVGTRTGFAASVAMAASCLRSWRSIGPVSPPRSTQCRIGLLRLTTALLSSCSSAVARADSYSMEPETWLVRIAATCVALKRWAVGMADRETMLTYDTPAHAAAAIDQILNRPEELRAVAMRGRQCRKRLRK